MITEDAVRDLELAELTDERTRLEIETFAREKMGLGEYWECEACDFCFGEIWAGFTLITSKDAFYKTHVNYYAARADFEAWRGKSMPAYLEGYLEDDPLWECFP